MSDSERLKSLIKEAEVYRKQGLLKQSLSKYAELSEFVRNHESFSKDQKLLTALQDKIRRVEVHLAEVESATDRPELPDKVQALISRLFSFSGNQEMAAVEGAVALAKFGQYERAVAEFERLIGEGILPRLSGTNLLSCHLTLGSPEAAIAQYEQWVSVRSLPGSDLQYLRGYLQSALAKKGIQAQLSAPEEPSAGSAAQVEDDKGEDFISISSVCITIPAGPKKGQVVEFDVTFQSGNALSIIIPAGSREVADACQAGHRLEDIQCYSIMGVFNGSGTVTGKSTISSGPKRGDFTLDITIDNA